MSANIEEEVQALERRAENLRNLLKYAPRPFVLEFAGTPKSGKTTTIEAIRHFLARNGYRVHVLTERAAICPVPMKGHLFFNMWCAASMLAELIANIDEDTDIIIVDRGFFDALVWLTLQERRGELTNDEARIIERFLLLDRWCRLIDLSIVMVVGPDEALARENRQRITQKGGSIMNREVLAAITESVAKAHERYRAHFNAIFEHETSRQDVRASSTALAGEILNSFEHFVNPPVLVVARQEIERMVSSGDGFRENGFSRALECIRANGKFVSRAEAEERQDLVQIVSAGVLVQDGRVFLFQRKESDPKYRLYGKTTIWQGSHVQDRAGLDIAEVLRFALQDRLSRALFLSRVFQTKELGYCWDQDDPKSSRHLGIMYRMIIDNPNTAADLRKKEFKRKRGHGLAGDFIAWEDLRKKADEINLESWSRTVLASGVK